MDSVDGGPSGGKNPFQGAEISLKDTPASPRRLRLKSALPDSFSFANQASTSPGLPLDQVIPEDNGPRFVKRMAQIEGGGNE